MVKVYEGGHRVVVSFSAGKDSGAALEICVIAAGMTGRLPVEVIMRDDEIMFPGTYEYAERIAARDEVSFNWIYANQPVINMFDRDNPYWWVFDPLLSPEDWVRQPPAIAQKIDELNIDSMTIPSRFPPAEGKDLYAVIGLRVQESRGRLYGLYSSGGYTTGKNRHGVISARPIYDWLDGDIWLAHKKFKWDYNEAYDVMARLGVSRQRLRIAPPTMNPAGAKQLAVARRAWPKWFERVSRRVQGLRTVANFGLRSVQPTRKLNETWQEAFQRQCIDEAPDWIRERSKEAARRQLSVHSHHSTSPFPDVSSCYTCGKTGSWKALADALYMGDPFSNKVDFMPYVEPEAFRPGAGTWGGTPTF